MATRGQGQGRRKVTIDIIVAIITVVAVKLAMIPEVLQFLLGEGRIGSIEIGGMMVISIGDTGDQSRDLIPDTADAGIIRDRRLTRCHVSPEHKPTVQPTMKSGTTLPAMFAELQNSDFKEQLKAMFVDAQTKTPDEIAKEIQLDETKLLKAKEKKSALPLNNQNPLAAMVAGGSKATAQQALSQTMAAMHAKVQEITGVAVPKYYNPSAVNPLKYAEQLKKRKMLWSKGKEADAATATAAEKVEKEAEVKPDIKSQLQWSGTSFSADDDGRMAAKFKKLMGIKQDGSSTLPANVDVTKLSEEQRKKQEELFQQLDREYEFARMATHTCRGVGFGFASSHNLPGS
ncbi:hypothetical protein HELRODRAFT_167096 [Helobdella robusta]|uniref:Small acidic protein-like domain-containing protein n=1 Tax=Helobdella robusta TaxID=6412 RepID=T1EZ08_HELRO|nr:hypothetical protein HELRODRAFT_167096 [Helobdella robusta]ESO10595.1 hypothetical protein HELRODRAFT_167096 [Helobdella robusta]